MAAVATTASPRAASGMDAVDGDHDRWSIEEPLERVPDHPLRGRVWDQAFNGSNEFQASFNDHAITITLTEKVGRWPAAQLIIFVSSERHGEEIVVTPMAEGNLPNIHMNVGMEGRNFPGTLMYTQMYSMRLNTERVDENTLHGRVHLSLPDYKKSHLIGEFTARKQ
ncbi:MAG: hypothetical protein EA377_09630 [Phycisphaerales bacterium]|nr:MAG: hypothetical protein EA377_09630 [Phycisphaerales bacterium]